jgi:hypothetical protein
VLECMRYLCVESLEDDYDKGVKVFVQVVLVHSQAALLPLNFLLLGKTGCWDC